MPRLINDMELWLCKARSTCEGITKKPKLLGKNFDHEFTRTQCWWWGNGASDSNKKFDPIQRMATLSMCPSASRRPTSPDQCSASRNIASDVNFFYQDWRMDCCQRRRKICPTEIANWLTIQSRFGMTVKCSPLNYELEWMPPLDLSGQTLPKEKRHSPGRLFQEMLCPYM